MLKPPSLKPPSLKPLSLKPLSLKPLSLPRLGLKPLGVALAALSLSLPAQAQEASITAGHELATARCSRCHAVDRTGDSPNPRSPRFRDLGGRFPFDGLREALMQGMIVGHPEMPIQHLTEAQSGDLIAYLRALQVRAPARQQGRRPPRARGI